MTNISKNALPEQEMGILFSQFEIVITRLSEQETSAFFSELLGKEERIMLAKRLAAIIMYIEGNSSYRVWQLLHISPSTAEKIRLDYECGRYRNLQRIVTRNRKNYQSLWQALEIVLQAGLPPRGRGRWKSVLERLSK